MIISRFVLGIAVGASVTVPAYLAEMSPVESRGRMVTQNELMIVSGQLLAFVFNAILEQQWETTPMCGGSCWSLRRFQPCSCFSG